MLGLIGNCLCCRKHKKSKDEFSGVEGMVKLRNLDDYASNSDLKVDRTSASNADLMSRLHGHENNSELKRVSNAPHRSLPDIPSDVPGDTNSDLYATVGDKENGKLTGQNKSPANLKKQISGSQHSSISQADDFSSPYARVRSPPHDYDKVKNEEHPYAQVAPTNRSVQISIDVNLDETDGDNSISRRQSLDTLEVDGSREIIPAASAIAGHISASQDLPYMTPPIVQPGQHFSGDSQDSSKGYTSISVREPLANLLISQPNHQNVQSKRRELVDSHYATVSDDSDEMYAAIDEPGGIQAQDLYTSGSETYAQIQSPSNLMTVSVEINSSAGQSGNAVMASTLSPSIITATTAVNTVPTPMPPSIDSLKHQTQHSRQASASSCNSSLGYIGSPKPEKRSANSPLPPTPHSSHKSPTSTSSNIGTSGRNSSASVIEVSGVVGIGCMPAINTLGDQKKSPTKDDVENMYAKVMKKSKHLSTTTTVGLSLAKNTLNSNNDLHNNNPDIFVSDPDITKEINLPDFDGISASPGKMSTKSTQSYDNNYETIDKKRNRSSSFNQKDPGYETIPAQKVGINSTTKSRLSAPVGQLLETGYESLTDPAYETLKRDSDYDPNYEVLRPSNVSDDGYAKIQDTTVIRKSSELHDGYSSIKSVRKNLNIELNQHGYAKIGNKKNTTLQNVNNNNNVIIDDDGSDIYSSIPSTINNPPYTTLRESSTSPSGVYSSIKNGSIRAPNETQKKVYECESLTGSDTDPNYETVRYLEPGASEHTGVPKNKNNESNNKGDNVNDYFNV